MDFAAGQSSQTRTSACIRCLQLSRPRTTAGKSEWCTADPSRSAGITGATGASFRPSATSSGTSEKSRAKRRRHPVRTVARNLRGQRRETATYYTTSVRKRTTAKRATELATERGRTASNPLEKLIDAFTDTSPTISVFSSQLSKGVPIPFQHKFYLVYFFSDLLYKTPFFFLFSGFGMRGLFKPHILTGLPFVLGVEIMLGELRYILEARSKHGHHQDGRNLEILGTYIHMGKKYPIVPPDFACQRQAS